jgi:hypothetical protein
MCGKDSYDSRWASVAGFCKHGNELLGYTGQHRKCLKVKVAYLQQFLGAKHKYDN